MSRLRARTWTAAERRTMKAWKFWNGFVMPIEALVADGEVLHQARDVFVDAERIMRAKGIDLNRACLRAIGDVETHIDPVTGIGYKDLFNAEFLRGFKCRINRHNRYCYHRDARRLSRYANRKYPLKRPAPVSRVIVHSPDVEAWYMVGWVPSDSNPNIYVRREA